MSNKPKQFKRPTRTQTLTVPFDPNDVAELRPAQERLRLAKEVLEKSKDDPTAIAEEAEAQAAYDKVLVGHETLTFHLRAMSSTQLQMLQSEFPPTSEQIAAIKKSDPDAAAPDFDPERYPPALLAKACVKVEWSDGTSAKLTAAQAKDFWDTSSAGDQEFLMGVIGMLNNMPSLVGQLGKG
jgi:hypothetical protein